MNVRDKRTLPLISATASKNKDGKIHISLSNVDVDNEQEVIVNLPGIQATKAAGEMLTSAQVTDYNSFENPDKVKLVPFKEVKINKGVLKNKNSPPNQSLLLSYSKPSIKTYCNQNKKRVTGARKKR